MCWMLFFDGEGESLGAVSGGISDGMMEGGGGGETTKLDLVGGDWTEISVDTTLSSVAIVGYLELGSTHKRRVFEFQQSEIEGSGRVRIIPSASVTRR